MYSDVHIIMRGAQRIASVIVLVILAAFITGCDSDEADTRDINFSHKEHIEKRQMECIDCHEGAEDTDTPGMPSEELCLECHKTLDKTLKGKESPPEEKCLYCHNPKKGVPLGDQKVVMGPGRSKGLKPIHAVHYEKDVECEACHGDIASDDNRLLPRNKYMPSPKDCIKCHEDRKPQKDCSACHTLDQQNVAPNTHKAGWITHHGIESQLVEKGQHGKELGKSTCNSDYESMVVAFMRCRS